MMYQMASPKKTTMTIDIMASRISFARAVVRIPNQHSSVMNPTASADSSGKGICGSSLWIVSAA